MSLNYARTFGNHSVTGLALLNRQEKAYYWLPRNKKMQASTYPLFPKEFTLSAQKTALMLP